jgi:hypothetical protein
MADVWTEEEQRAAIAELLRNGGSQQDATGCGSILNSKPLRVNPTT